MRKLLVLFVVLWFAIGITAEAANSGKSKDVREWLTFRASEEANKGRKVTWKCIYQTDNVTRASLGSLTENSFRPESRELSLKDDRGKKVYVQCGSFGSIWYIPWEKAGKVTKNDILLITAD